MADIRALIDEGLDHHRAGRVREAGEAYRRVLAADPGNAEAQHLVGILRFQAGEAASAADSFERALATDPGNARYRANLGGALLVLGRLDAAIAALEAAAALAPDTPELLNNLAAAYRQARRPADAVAASRRAVEIFPDDTAVHEGLAASLLAMGEPSDAEAAARRAVALDPANADALNTLGAALLGGGRFEAAIETLRRAVARASDRSEPARNLALALQEARAYAESAEQYERTIAQWPDDAAAHAGLARTRRLQGQLAEAIAAGRRAVALDDSNPVYLSNLLFCLIGSPDEDGPSLLEEHRRWGDRFAPPVPAPVFGNDRNPDRKLRVGWVSPDFRDHPVGHIALAVLRAHDSGRAEVICYTNSGGTDATGAAIAAASDAFVPIAGLSDREAASRIAGDRVDILVDLAGHSARNRLGVFAYRPAPIQASWMGYMATTGVSAIDYVIGDPVHTPEAFDGHFVEAVWRLPRDLAVFAPPVEAPPVGPAPAVAAGRITFGAFNNPGKTTDEAIALWASILRDVPDATLLMRYAGCEDRAVQRGFTDRFAGHGIASGRLFFEGSTGYADALATYNRVDIALDSFPYSGTMTTMEALWMGVPVVALAGSRMAARQAAAHLTAAGLAEFVADDTADYRRIAVGLARDPDRLQSLRTGMRERLTVSPLTDAAGLARALEDAWRGMWRHWCGAEAGI